MHTALTSGHRSCTCGPKPLYGWESPLGQLKAFHWLSGLEWYLGEQFALYRIAITSLILPSLPLFKCVTISHQLHNCLALQPITTNRFPCISVKGKQVYFTFWSFSSSLSSFSLIINVLQSGLYGGFDCTLIRQWYVSESPYLCLFTEKLAQGLAHGSQRDAVCPFPLKGDRNVSWFSGIENGSISSHQVLLV